MVSEELSFEVSERGHDELQEDLTSMQVARSRIEYLEGPTSRARVIPFHHLWK